MGEFTNVKVNKPWGEEYLIYENSNIAIWILHINRGESTSLHCHPNKKTGLVLLQGIAHISFLSGNGNDIIVSDKTMIRQGVFHKTYAYDNSIIMEVETPVDKNDLVRIMDDYGRAGEPYESNKETYYHNIDITQDKKLFQCNINKRDIRVIKDLGGTISSYLCLSGCINAYNNVVYGPGDIISYNSMKILLTNFTPADLVVLEIS